MTEIWFSSDLHFFHRNIIKFCNRPFENTYRMNEALISNAHEKVKPDDHFYILGDFGMGSKNYLQGILDRLPGKFKFLIRGNHDKTAVKLDGWTWIKDYHEMNIDKQMIVLHHYAQRVWNKNGHGSIMLYGHSHGKLPGNSQSLDVGVDPWNYYPCNIEDIKRRLKTLPKYTGYGLQAGGSDHHGTKDMDL